MARRYTVRKGRQTARAPECSETADEVIVLNPSLEMRNARALKALLLECLASHGPCRINASRVERTSTGCLQVLAAFAVSMAAAQRRVTVENPSADFADAVSALGLTAILPVLSMEA